MRSSHGLAGRRAARETPVRHFELVSPVLSKVRAHRRARCERWRIEARTDRKVRASRTGITRTNVVRLQ